MTEYFAFINEPNAIMYRIFANNKHEALKKYNDKMGTSYKFKRSHIAPLQVVTVFDWQHYNFGKISYAAQG